MSIEEQLSNAVQATNNLTAAVNGKIGQIDQRVQKAEEDFNAFMESADTKYQRFVKTGGKVFGDHYVMDVDPPNYVDPTNADYRSGMKNGMLLWRVGDGFDNKRVIPIGLQGSLTLTRYGFEMYQTGEFRVLRQYDAYYSFVATGLKVALETMTYDGKQYLALTSDMAGGGAVILNGLAAFSGNGYSGDTGSIRDENFGRRVNTKDGAVYAELAPFALLPYA